jgi:hypothetical protein
MTINFIFKLFLSNAVHVRRDISILFNIIAILISSIYNDIFTLTVITKGISLHGGLLLSTNLKFNAKTIKFLPRVSTNNNSKFGNIYYYSTNNNIGNNNVVPAVIYTNANTEKELILKENKGKSGIYR